MTAIGQKKSDWNDGTKPVAVSNEHVTPASHITPAAVSRIAVERLCDIRHDQMPRSTATSRTGIRFCCVLRPGNRLRSIVPIKPNHPLAIACVEQPDKAGAQRHIHGTLIATPLRTPTFRHLLRTLPQLEEDRLELHQGGSI